MAYNLTNITGSLDPVQTIQALNQSGDYIIGLLIILAVPTLITIILIRIGTTPLEALATGGITTGILGLFLMLTGFISDTIAFPFIMLGILLAIIAYITRRQ